MQLRCFFMLILISVLVLAAGCSNIDGYDQTNNADSLEIALKAVSELLGQPEDIQLKLGRYNVFAPVDEEQFHELAAWLSEIDLGGFEEAKREDLEGSFGTCEFLIEKNGKSYEIKVYEENDPDAVFLIFSNYKPIRSRAEALAEAERRMEGEDKEILLRGLQTHIGDTKRLSDIFASVRLDRSDPENCAEITALTEIDHEHFNVLKPKGASLWAMKGNSVMLKAIFDGFAQSDPIPIDSINKEDCDLKIVIGDTIYLYDIETGAYIVNGQNFKLEEQWQQTLWQFFQ